MLYRYNGKIYVKPLVNKIVEVTVEKKGDEYNIKPAKEFIYLTPEIKSKMVEISVEEAAKSKNKSSLEL